MSVVYAAAESTREVILLFVSVFVAEIVSTTTPSTAMTPADDREIVVSDTAPSSIVPVVNTPDVVRLRLPFVVRSPDVCVIV